MTNELVRSISIAAVIATASIFLIDSYSDEYVEVEGHTYESIFILLNTYEDESLFNQASLAMSDDKITKAESITFFKYAMDNLSPITMAPVFRGESLIDSYPVAEYRKKLQEFFFAINRKGDSK